MDGWMDGSMDGWMDGQMDGWMDGWMGTIEMNSHAKYGSYYESTTHGGLVLLVQAKAKKKLERARWMHGCTMDRWMDRSIDRWMKCVCPLVLCCLVLSCLVRRWETSSASWFRDTCSSNSSRRSPAMRPKYVHTNHECKTMPHAPATELASIQSCKMLL